MAIKIDQDAEKYLISAIKRFFAEDLEEEIGDLKAMQVLDFCLKEIGPSIYNRAIADAQAFIQEKTSDLSGVLYEVERDFRKSQ